MKSRRLVPALVGSAFLSLLPCGLISQDRTQPQCSVATIFISLTGATHVEQRIGNLMFEMKPLKGASGWLLSLEDTNGHDLICPVNAPIRTCEEEQVGAGYGETAKQALSHGRELRFLLSTSDYDGLEPYVERALAPATQAELERAGNEYFDQSDNLRTGLLRLSVHSDMSENDEVRSADLKLEVFAPSTFPFAPALRPQIVACPEAALPITERLPARIPAADPEKYRSVIEGRNWKNPYVQINRDGFSLRFEGGELNGPMSALARTIVGLPGSVWPYGRVIVAAENGVRNDGDDAPIRKNRDAADTILTGLGLVVWWWPSG